MGISKADLARGSERKMDRLRVALLVVLVAVMFVHNEAEEDVQVAPNAVKAATASIAKSSAAAQAPIDKAVKSAQDAMTSAKGKPDKVPTGSPKGFAAASNAMRKVNGKKGKLDKQTKVIMAQRKQRKKRQEKADMARPKKNAKKKIAKAKRKLAKVSRKVNKKVRKSKKSCEKGEEEE